MFYTHDYSYNFSLVQQEDVVAEWLRREVQVNSTSS